MAHEELKKQYEEDCKNYERPWELWEYHSGNGWHTCRYEPEWCAGNRYRHKEPPFQPEYFSGLNYLDAQHLEKNNSLVECSNDGQNWCGPFKLRLITDGSHCFQVNCGWWTYIRTVPQTYAHPTIKITANGKDYELPKPETKLPEVGTRYWAFDPMECDCIDYEHWQDDVYDNWRLKNKTVHLTEPRAQAWADFWKEITS